MNDDDIIARGGTQEDIDSYAEANGATDPRPSDDTELREELESILQIKLNSRLHTYVQTATDFMSPISYERQIQQLEALILRNGLEARLYEAKEIIEHFKSISAYTKMYGSPRDFVIRQLDDRIHTLTTKQDTKEK